MSYYLSKDFIIIPSSKKYKKYDVLNRETGKKVLSFGDKRYQHYKDKLGYYKDLDHRDKKRRSDYYKRHKKNYAYPSADWFSKNILW